MKHYGIWTVKDSAWVRNMDGMIFWTTSMAVAQAQLELMAPMPDYPCEVKEFSEDIKQQ